MNLKNSAPGDYDVRLNQPAMMTRCRWFIGDVTEVLDQNTWKLGKIAKMLKNNYFVIRLADCIQLKEFHITSLRVPLQDDPPTAAPYSKQFPAFDKAAVRRGKQVPADLLGRSSGNNKKRKPAAALDSPPQPRQRRLLPHAHKAAEAAAAMGDPPLQQRYLQAEAECSVASCSADNDGAAAAELRFGGNGRCSVGRGDAMSAAAAAGGGGPCAPSGSTEDDGVLSDGESGDSGGGGVDVHELELEAYRSTVRALHASGPLTWEQESLLTNLRLSLNISNEEHLLQLRRLLSS